MCELCFVVTLIHTGRQPSSPHRNLSSAYEGDFREGSSSQDWLPSLLHTSDELLHKGIPCLIIKYGNGYGRPENFCNFVLIYFIFYFITYVYLHYRYKPFFPKSEPGSTDVEDGPIPHGRLTVRLVEITRLQWSGGPGTVRAALAVDSHGWVNTLWIQ